MSLAQRTRTPTAGARGRGQATVELALVLPLLGLLALVLVHVGLVVRDQVLVTHAAREGARAAAVEADPDAARRAALAAADLDPDRVSVVASGRGEPGSLVTVTVRYRSSPGVPWLHRFVGDVELHASATMRVE